MPPKKTEPEGEMRPCHQSLIVYRITPTSPTLSSDTPTDEFTSKKSFIPCGRVYHWATHIAEHTFLMLGGCSGVDCLLHDVWVLTIAASTSDNDKDGYLYSAKWRQLDEDFKEWKLEYPNGVCQMSGAAQICSSVGLASPVGQEPSVTDSSIGIFHTNIFLLGGWCGTPLLRVNKLTTFRVECDEMSEDVHIHFLSVVSESHGTGKMEGKGTNDAVYPPPMTLSTSWTGTSQRPGATKSSLNERVYFFGGCVSGGMLSNDLYSYEPTREDKLDNGNWHLSRLGATQGSNAIPVKKVCASACIKIADEKVIMFGGRLESGELSNELTAFDMLTQQWLPVKTTTTQPSARHSHAMCLIDTQTPNVYRALLYGGISVNGTSLNDIFILELNVMKISGNSSASTVQAAWMTPRFDSLSISLPHLYGHSLHALGTRGVIVLGGKGDNIQSYNESILLIEMNSLGSSVRHESSGDTRNTPS